MPPKTPPPKPPPTLETPISVRSTSGHSYDATLEASRKAVMEDLHRIPIVNIDDMLTAMFPHVNPTLAHGVVNKLRELAHINARGRWQAFDVEPSKQTGTEDSVYNKGLLDTFNQIISATKILVTDINIPVPMALNVTGAKTPRSERSNSSRPDGYFRLQSSTIPLQRHPSSKSRPDLPHWADIVCPMEFKKADNDGNKYDDMWKVVWSMHQIMRSDPLRRFALGITIENTTLRFWISHRAYLVASTPIDINSKPVDLVRVFLGIALSPADRLGYDPTITRVESRDGDGKYSYDITVHDRSGKERIFRTKDEISTYGADAVRGRGTRVWSVYDKMDDPDGKRLYALKDTWVNADRTREGDTLRILRERLIERKEIDGLNHLLTEVASGDVDVRKRADNTGASIQNGKLFTVDSIVETWFGSDGVGGVEDIVPARSGSKRSASSMGDVPNIEPPAAGVGLRIGQLLEEHRVHYRIVFEEVGTPIHQLRTFSEIFVALRDAVCALKAMFSVKYIHRDVSSSNILLLREPGEQARGLLVDLEYAKDVTIETTPHEFRTGTRDFMAVEVRESLYLFHPPDSEDPSELVLPPFRHNCLHDLESAWWVALWATYVFAPIVPSEQDVSYFYQLFPPLHVQGLRTSIGNTLMLGPALSKMRPEQNKPIFDSMYRWRHRLYTAYSILEKNLISEGKLDESIFKHVHDEALHPLNELLVTLKMDQLGTLDLVHMQFSDPGKAKRSRVG